jgi:prepilin-type processing-associated H-X9-DG protein/prepilin-type N-terminal cleavage/methylation domain-containing protein
MTTHPNSPGPDPFRRVRAFTLIELLVVVATIAILAAIFLPAIGRAKESGYTAVCRNNQCQLGLAVGLYANDSTVFPPYWSVRRDGSFYLWWAPLVPYVKDTWPATDAPGVDKVPYLKEEKIRHPSDMIAIGDVNSAAGTVDISPFGPGLNYQIFFQVSGLLPYEWPAAIHQRGANMVFADGHVEYGSQTNWTRKTETARRRWNADNASHPETW